MVRTGEDWYGKQMTKTIKALIPPVKEKAPCKVVFTDDTNAQYWPDAKFGAALEVGVTAECVTETKTFGEYTNTYLKQWGEPVQRAKGGFPGRQPMAPEERRSIAAQAMIKAACELFSGVTHQPGTTFPPNYANMAAEVISAATRFMAFHDQQVAQTPAPKVDTPQNGSQVARTAFGYTAPEGQLIADPETLKKTVARLELTAPQTRALRSLVLNAYGLHHSQHLSKDATGLLTDFMISAPKASVDKAIEAAKELVDMDTKAVIPQNQESPYA